MYQLPELPLSFISNEYQNWLAHIRQRPGLWLGPQDHHGLHHQLDRLCADAHTTATSVPCHHLTVTVATDGSCCIESDGSGVWNSDSQSAATLHPLIHHLWHLDATSTPILALQIALSTHFTIEIRTGQERYKQTFQAGLPVTPILHEHHISQPGQTLIFAFDPYFFRYPYHISTYRLIGQFQQRAALTADLHIHVIDQRSKLDTHIHYEEGLCSYLQELAHNSWTYRDHPIHLRQITTPIQAEIAFQWIYQSPPWIRSYVNGEETFHGGSHVRGFWQGVTTVLEQYLHMHRLVPASFPAIRRKQIPHMMNVLIAVWVEEPIYADSLKTQLRQREIAYIVRQLVESQLLIQLETHHKFIATWANQLVRDTLGDSAVKHH